jgi:thioredoxin-related protein
VYQDKTYKFKKQGSRGFHELAAQLLNNRLSYPSFVILNEQQEVIQPIPGYQNAKKLDIILHYFGTDNHKKTPWEKYERTYSKGN